MKNRIPILAGGVVVLAVIAIAVSRSGASTAVAAPKVVNAKTIQEARSAISQALTNVSIMRAAADSSSNDSNLRKASLEQLDGVKARLLATNKVLTGEGVLSSALQMRVRTALLDADAHIKVVRDSGIKTSAQLGVSLANEFAKSTGETFQAIGSGVGAVASTTASIASNLIAGLAKGLGPILVILVLLVVGIVIVNARARR